MIKRVIFVFFVTICSFSLMNGQGPSSYFSMDDCMLTDEMGNVSASIVAAGCGCGVSSNGLQFQGAFDFATFDDELNDIFKSDWSLSMYVQVLNEGTEAVDILFLGERCGIDSLLSLRYLPVSKRFRFLLSSSPAIGVQLDGLADDNSCWQHIVITKARSNVLMYINSELVDQDAATSDIILDVQGQLMISNSPCLLVNSNPDTKFRGVIDELEFYTRPISALEIVSSAFLPDKIIGEDTTIFVGESVRIETGGSCSQNFEWSPEDFLDDPNSLNPLSTPSENITYTLTIDGEGGCRSVDEITIRVADPSNLTCSDLLLPSAFTPNNDNINDEYGISNSFLIDQLSSFEIFNKWGGRVFSTNISSDKWDGFYQGTLAPPDSYVYKVVYVCDNELFTKSGVVSLLR